MRWSDRPGLWPKAGTIKRLKDTQHWLAPTFNNWYNNILEEGALSLKLSLTQEIPHPELLPRLKLVKGPSPQLCWEAHPAWIHWPKWFSIGKACEASPWSVIPWVGCSGWQQWATVPPQGPGAWPQKRAGQPCNTPPPAGPGFSSACWTPSGGASTGPQWLSRTFPLPARLSLLPFLVAFQLPVTPVLNILGWFYPAVPGLWALHAKCRFWQPGSFHQVHHSPAKVFLFFFFCWYPFGEPLLLPHIEGAGCAGAWAATGSGLGPVIVIFLKHSLQKWSSVCAFQEAGRIGLWIWKLFNAGGIARNIIYLILFLTVVTGGIAFASVSPSLYYKHVACQGVYRLQTALPKIT